MSEQPPTPPPPSGQPYPGPPPPPTQPYQMPPPRSGPPSGPPQGPPNGPPQGPPSGPPPWTPGPSPYGAPGGPGAPKKSRLGLFLGIGALVATILIVFGITAFAAPGFLVDDDTPTAREDNQSSSDDESDEPESSDSDDTAESVMEQVESAFNEGDTSSLTALACEGASPNVAGATGSADDVDETDLGDVIEESDTEVSADFTVTVGGDDLDFTIVAADPGSGWCWQDLVDSGDVELPAEPSASAPTDPAPEIPTGIPTPDLGADETQGAAVMQQFVDAVNAQDRPSVDALLCPDSGMDVLVDSAFAADAKLTLDIDESVTGIGSVLGTLSGTQNGAEIEDGGIIVTAMAGSWCVSTFYAY